MERVKKEGKSHSIFGWTFIILLCVLVFCFWLLMHRVIPEDTHHVKLDNNFKSKQHIQNLIQETHKLLQEVIASNVSISKSTLHDLNVATADANHVNKDITELNKQLTRLEDGYTICMKQKYDLTLSLQTCNENKQASIDHSTGSNKIPSTVTLPVASTTIQKTIETLNPSSITQTTTDKWLVIGIPTVSRMHNEEYLIQSLETLAKQLPTEPSDLLYHKILINIVNLQINTNPDQEHIIYNKIKQKYSKETGHPLAGYFQFTDIISTELLKDPKPHTNIQNDKGNANHPGFIVRRQTRNLVTVIRKNLNIAKYYLFLEDDMEFCSHGLLAIQYMLNKANRYHPNWLAIRASYGMNGIFMHNKDLKVFADYLEKHQARRPPDHLVVEWYAGETKESALYKGHRVNIGFKYNLFNHIGVVSTLRTQRSTSYPKCYDMLTEPTVFQVEAYNPRQCPQDDIWPCSVQHPDPYRIDWAHQQSSS